MEESDRWESQWTHAFLGEMYIIFDREVDSLEFGWPGKRTRYIAVCFHRRYVADITTSLDRAVQLFSRTCSTDWRCFFFQHEEWADDEIGTELGWELGWAFCRTKSRSLRADPLPVQADADAWDVLIGMGGVREACEGSLTALEYKFLNDYPQRCICSLNQDYSKGRGHWAEVQSHMYCIIRNPTFHFNKLIGRWATASEVLTMMGFPVMRRHANPRGSPGRACSFTKALPEDAPRCITWYRGLPRESRDRNKMIAQAGNSINIPVAGFIELYIMLFSTVIDPSVLR